MHLFLFELEQNNHLAHCFLASSHNFLVGNPLGSDCEVQEQHILILDGKALLFILFLLNNGDGAILLLVNPPPALSAIVTRDRGGVSSVLLLHSSTLLPFLPLLLLLILLLGVGKEPPSSLAENE